MTSPTEKLYDGLQDAFRTFNQELFDGRLSDCLITVKKQANSHGYYKIGEFNEKGGATKLPELALNPNSFQRDDKRTLSTLVHEMVHHWQYCYGEPGSRGYHNREWADHMEAIGLMPSSTGEPGGKRTGGRVSHWIIPGGEFDRIADDVIAAGFSIDWATFAGTESQQDKSKVKHTCPSCGLNAWGKEGIYLFCGNCLAFEFGPELLGLLEPIMANARMRSASNGGSQQQRQKQEPREMTEPLKLSAETIEDIEEAIRKARSEMQKQHPDRGGDAEAFRQAKQSYDELKGRKASVTKQAA